MLFENMSKEAKIKDADFSMKVSSTLFSALVITLLITPLLALIKTTDNSEPVFIFNLLSGFNGLLFIIFECLAFIFVAIFRFKALRVYNELKPDKSTFDCNKREPKGELALQLEAIEEMPAREKMVVKEVLASLIIKSQSRRWDSRRQAAK